MYMDDYKRWASAKLEDPTLTEELQKRLEKKTQRDHDRHRNNPKLKSASTPPDNGQETDKE